MRVAVYGEDAPVGGRTGLALCGGGIMGAFFEAGVLAALDDVLGRPVSTAFDAYVGASAGASVAAFCAQDIAAGRLFRALYDEDDDFFPLRRKHVWRLDPLRIGRIVGGLARAAATGGDLGDLLPAGLFRLGEYRAFLADRLRRAGLSARFEDLRRELYVAANDVDSGDRVVFGEPPLRDVDIPTAVAASSAIPMFFEPVRIAGRDYFDGGIGRVAHADVLVRHGATRILVVNPVVPIRNDPARVCIPSRRGNCSRIVDKGLLAVGSQAFRIMNKVRLHLGLKRLVAEHPAVRVILIEPGEEEAVLFLHGSMSLAGRHAVLDYARSTAARVLPDHREQLGLLASH